MDHLLNLENVNDDEKKAQSKESKVEPEEEEAEQNMKKKNDKPANKLSNKPKVFNFST